ncbi:MAG: CoA transferase [Chloroflexi bacterium]|nr:CoA transferase [Chloroflexota bacterium]
MPGPLDGIKMLEFTEIIAGPFGGMLLGDMGADIIKIEPPWGEPWRFAQPFIPGESKTYIGLNRNKRSLPLDLTKPEAREIVHKLVETTDVVMINSRPDVPYNLGIDYETLSAINPRLIYCENTAFGRKGPHNYRPGYDIIVQAMSGLMASEGKVVDGVPQQIQSTAIADFATGIAIAWAVCGALYSREKNGKGQKIETTLLGTALAVQTSKFMQVAAIDDEPRRDFLRDLEEQRSAGVGYEKIHEDYSGQNSPLRALRLGNIYYRTYQAKDGVLAVGCLSDPLRKKLCDVLELEDIRFEPDYDPQTERAKEFGDALILKAEARFLLKSVNEWLAVLDGVGVPAGPVRFIEELVDDEQVLANDLVVSLKHSLAGDLKMVGPLLKMSETPLEARMASPALGEHTDSILGELDYSPEEIARLKEAGVTL